MPLPQSSDPSNWSSLMLSIDFRSGSVVMQAGRERWTAPLTLNSADCSQINTPRLEIPGPSFALSPAQGG